MIIVKPKVNVWFLEPVPRAELFYLCMEDLEIAVDAVGCLDSELL